jgi:hypothetical protein
VLQAGPALLQKSILQLVLSPTRRRPTHSSDFANAFPPQTRASSPLASAPKQPSTELRIGTLRLQLRMRGRMPLQITAPRKALPTSLSTLRIHEIALIPSEVSHKPPTDHNGMGHRITSKRSPVWFSRGASASAFCGSLMRC